MKDEQVRELLYQALETEIGGVDVYTTALRCANIFRWAGNNELADGMISLAEREWSAELDDDPHVRARLEMALGNQALQLGNTSGFRDWMRTTRER